MIFWKVSCNGFNLWCEQCRNYAKRCLDLLAIGISNYINIQCRLFLTSKQQLFLLRNFLNSIFLTLLIDAQTRTCLTYCNATYRPLGKAATRALIVKSPHASPPQPSACTRLSCVVLRLHTVEPSWRVTVVRPLALWIVSIEPSWRVSWLCRLCRQPASYPRTATVNCHWSRSYILGC